MVDELFTDSLTIEDTIAVWIDGGLSCDEEIELFNVISENKELGEILDDIDVVDNSYETLIETGFELPSDLLFDFQLPDLDTAEIFEEPEKEMIQEYENHNQGWDDSEQLEDNISQESNLGTDGEMNDNLYDGWSDVGF